MVIEIIGKINKLFRMALRSAFFMPYADIVKF